MADINLNGYYNRAPEEQGKNYEKHLFRAGYVLQSAEVNEIQEYAANRSKQIGDALFKDGDIIRDARAVVDSETGATQLESGAIYLQGSVRGVPSATLNIPTVGTIILGIYLEEKVVTEVEDPTLLDPAKETRSYNEPGAARLQVIPRWGYYAENDPAAGQFYPIYYVDDGQLRAKEAPPQLDSVSQAIAKYDRDSTASGYIVSGMDVTMLDDLEDGTQVYSIRDGNARINGFGMTLTTSRRLTYAAVPDLKYIDSEPHTSTASGSQRVNVFRPPINDISQVRITSQKTVSIVHGSVSGSQDPLPDTSIIDIISVTQGATTYVKGTDYQLTAGKVDWSLPGAEPATGSTYSVTYQYITTVEPTNVDDTGFTVTGAVSGSLILINYQTKLPRIDRLCMDETGAFLWLKGVATDYNPVRPSVPSNIMALCQVVQTWTASRYVIPDGVRMTSMSEIEGLRMQLNTLTDLVAQQKLVSDIGVRDAAAKKGMFVDPFLDDSQRDQGITQTAAVLGYALTLPISGDAAQMQTDVTGPVCCDFTLSVVLQNTARTGGMNINPYMAFAVPPSAVTLTPNVDRWTVTKETWLSPITQKFIIDNAIKDAYHYQIYGTNLAGWPSSTTSTTSTVLVSSSTSKIQYLRQISVQFEVHGWGPGEQLTSLKFDGVSVTPTAI